MLIYRARLPDFFSFSTVQRDILEFVGARIVSSMISFMIQFMYLLSFIHFRPLNGQIEPTGFPALNVDNLIPSNRQREGVRTLFI